MKGEGHSPHILLEAWAWTLEANHTEGPPAGAPASPLARLSSVLFGCWVGPLQKAAFVVSVERLVGSHTWRLETVPLSARTLTCLAGTERSSFELLKKKKKKGGERMRKRETAMITLF